MNKSLWIESEKIKEYGTLKDNKMADVCVVGGGITGITTAYYLAKEGKKVILLEKNSLGSHATGNTTGKITSQHGLFYTYLINSFGKDVAKKYLEANEQAIKNIENIIVNENINCDFEKQSNYVFTQKKDELKK